MSSSGPCLFIQSNTWNMALNIVQIVCTQLLCIHSSELFLALLDIFLLQNCSSALSISNPFLPLLEDEGPPVCNCVYLVILDRLYGF